MAFVAVCIHNSRVASWCPVLCCVVLCCAVLCCAVPQERKDLPRAVLKKIGKTEHEQVRHNHAAQRAAACHQLTRACCHDRTRACAACLWRLCKSWLHSGKGWAASATPGGEATADTTLCMQPCPRSDASPRRVPRDQEAALLPGRRR